MEAIRFEQFGGTLSLVKVANPRAIAKSVVIKVMATGLCRSDWHAWMGHDTGITLPHIPGHEFAGVIVEIGSEVQNFQVGDRVTVPFVCGCGICNYCLRGDAQVCPFQTQPGFTHFGSFAQDVEIHNADFNLVRLPDELSFESAASLGCRFATSFRGLVDRAKVQVDDFVAIIGCGGVGLSAIMIAKAFGARTIAVDISDLALAKAKAIGADFIINSGKSDALVEILTLTGDGADIAIDALGSEATSTLGILALRRRGKYLQLGLLPSESGKSSIPMARAIAYELDLLGSHGMAAVDYPRLLEMVSNGKLRPDLLIEERISFADIPEALANFANRTVSGITIAL